MAYFYKRLKQLREERGWTQDEIAEKLGVSRPTIAGYESEEKNRIPREETLLKIADLFGESIDYLLGRTNDRSKVAEEAALYMAHRHGKRSIEVDDEEEEDYLKQRQEEFRAWKAQKKREREQGSQ